MSNIAATKFAAAAAAINILDTFLAAASVTSPVYTKQDGPTYDASYGGTRRIVGDWADYLCQILSTAQVRCHCTEVDDPAMQVTTGSQTYVGDYVRVRDSDGNYINGTQDGSNDFVTNANYSVWAKQSGASAWEVVIFDGSDWIVYQSSTNPATYTNGGATNPGTEVSLTNASDTRYGLNVPDLDDANIVAYKDDNKAREIKVYSQATVDPIDGSDISGTSTELMGLAGTLLVRQVNIS